MKRQGQTVRAVTAAFLANFAIFILKLAGALFTHSSAMLAEAFHSLADSGNQVFLWLGLRLSERPPDRRHPFGYGKERFFWSFLVAVLLFSVGGLYSVYEGMKRALHGQDLHHAGWNLLILGGGVVFEGISWWIAIRQLKPGLRSPGRFYRYVRETRAPTLVVIVFEDSAALTGLVLAAVGVGLTLFTGVTIWDALASVAIGLLLMSVAFVIAREARSLLLGEGLAPHETERLTRALEALPEVASVMDLRSLFVGPQALIVAVDLVLRPTARNPEEIVCIKDRVEDQVRALHPEAQYIYVEIEGLQHRPQTKSP